MGITEIVLLGIALSMDAFAVTISNTFVYQNNSKARALLMPVAFGLFQGLMPCIGYFLGHLVSGVISHYAGIITFAILGFIGAKMIWDALHEEHDRDAMPLTQIVRVLPIQKISAIRQVLTIHQVPTIRQIPANKFCRSLSLDFKQLQQVLMPWPSE